MLTPWKESYDQPIFYGFESLPAFLGLQFPYSIFRGWKISLELHILPSLLDLYCSLFPFLWTLAITLGCPGGASGFKKKKKTNKNPPAVQEMGRYGFNSWVGQIRWRRQWLPTPVFLPGESHGQRSLVGCTVHSVTKDLDMTEATQHVCTAITLDPPS